MLTPSAASCKTRSTTREIAAPNGSALRICEPIWTLTPAGIEMARLRRRAIDRPRLADIDAELVLAQAGRDIWVGLGKDIRIDPQRNPRANPLLRGALREQLDLRLAFHVKDENAGAQREVHLRPPSSPPRKRRPVCAACLSERQHPLQFAARDDVESPALAVDQA